MEHITNTAKSPGLRGINWDGILETSFFGDLKKSPKEALVCHIDDLFGYLKAVKKEKEGLQSQVQKAISKARGLEDTQETLFGSFKKERAFYSSRFEETVAENNALTDEIAASKAKADQLVGKLKGAQCEIDILKKAKGDNVTLRKQGKNELKGEQSEQPKGKVREVEMKKIEDQAKWERQQHTLIDRRWKAVRKREKELGDIDALRAERDSLVQRVGELGDNARTAHTRIESLVEQLRMSQAAEAKLSRVQQQLEEATEQLKNSHEQLQALKNELGRSESDLFAARQAVAAKEARMSELVAELEESCKKAETYSMMLERIKSIMGPSQGHRVGSADAQASGNGRAPSGLMGVNSKPGRRPSILNQRGTPTTRPMTNVSPVALKFTSPQRLVSTRAPTGEPTGCAGGASTKAISRPSGLPQSNQVFSRESASTQSSPGGPHLSARSKFSPCLRAEHHLAPFDGSCLKRKQIRLADEDGPKKKVKIVSSELAKNV